MKKHAMPEMKEGGVNVTPLIDIVMCLIIFFMLVAKIGVTRGEDKDIKLPDTILGTKIADLGNTLTLNVHAVGGSNPGVPQVTSINNGQKAALDILTANGDRPLRRVLTEFKKTHGEKTSVIIRGGSDPLKNADDTPQKDEKGDTVYKELTYGQLEQVLMEIATAGITDVAYETRTSAAPEAPAP